jgi:hypothetical protein
MENPLARWRCGPQHDVHSKALWMMERALGGAAFKARRAGCACQ